MFGMIVYMIGSHFIIISLSSSSHPPLILLSSSSHPPLILLSSSSHPPLILLSPFSHLTLISVLSSKSLPQYIRYIFDQSSPDARMAVILSSYDTHRERTAEIERTELLPPVSYDPPRYNDSGTGVTKDFIEYWVSPNHSAIFNVLVLDEAHRANNSSPSQ